MIECNDLYLYTGCDLFPNAPSQLALIPRWTKRHKKNVRPDALGRKYKLVNLVSA